MKIVKCRPPDMSWWAYTLISAVAPSATAILAKVGVQGVPSNLATAIRTVVILLFAWGIVMAGGEHRDWAKVSQRSLLFLVVSGVATGVSWLASPTRSRLQSGAHRQAEPGISLHGPIALVGWLRPVGMNALTMAGLPR